MNSEFSQTYNRLFNLALRKYTRAELRKNIAFWVDEVERLGGWGRLAVEAQAEIHALSDALEVLSTRGMLARYYPEIVREV